MKTPVFKLITLEERIVLNAALAAVAHPPHADPHSQVGWVVDASHISQQSPPPSPDHSLNVPANNIIYVNAKSTSSNPDGTSWNSAYDNLQSALQKAQNSNQPYQIWVAAGDYSPGSSPLSTFRIPNNVEIFGGFNGTETTLASRNIAQNSTILDGLGVNSNVVTVDNATVIIDGVTIQGGHNTTGDGGAILETNGSNVLLANDTITHDSAVLGGGVYSDQSALYVKDSTFSQDTAQSGGGIYSLTDSIVSVDGSTFSSDSATGGSVYGFSGGAVFGQYDANLSITGSTFSGNTAGFAGGAIAGINDGSAAIHSNFDHNSALAGGAVELFGINDSTVTGQFTSNSAIDGGGIDAFHDGTITINNSLFQSNTADNGSAIMFDTVGSAAVNLDSFQGNTSSFEGGAIYGRNVDTVSVVNDDFSSNAADYGGAAMFESSQDVTFSHDTFSGDKAFYGGALYAYMNTNLTVANSTFQNESATDGDGGAIFSLGNGTVTIQGNTASSNSSSSAGGAVYDSGSSSLSITGNNFSGDQSGQGLEINLANDSSVNGITLGAYPAESAISNLILQNSGFGSTAQDVSVDGTSGNTLIVFVNGNNGNPAAAQNGLSWNEAYTNLQDGLNAAGTIAAQRSAPVEVWVAAGTYTLLNNFAPFVLPSNIQMMGGFAGTETSAQQANPALNATTLDGTGGNNGIMTITNGVDTIEGLTFANGNNPNDTFNASGAILYGGAVTINDSSVTFVDDAFINNSSNFYGGAIAAAQSYVQVNSSVFEGNFTAWGSGSAIVGYKGGTLGIDSSQFFGSQTRHPYGQTFINFYGDSLQITSKVSPTVFNMTYNYNTAVYDYSYGNPQGGSLLVDGVQFLGNYNTGIQSYGIKSIVVTNSIFNSQTVSPYQQYGLSLYNTGSLYVSHDTFSGLVPISSYILTQEATITQNTFNTFGISLSNDYQLSTQINIVDNNFNGGGISLGLMGQINISGNTFTNSEVDVHSDAYTQIIGNKFTNSVVSAITDQTVDFSQNQFANNLNNYQNSSGFNLGPLTFQDVWTVNMTDNTITGNTNTNGNGIVNFELDRTVNLDNNLFSGNTATQGVIWIDQSSANVDNSSLVKLDGTFNISNSTFTGNTAQDAGGAIYASLNVPNSFALTLSNDVFSGNLAANGGGAVYIANAPLSNALFSVENSSFTGNSTAGGSGGAISVQGLANLTVGFSTFQNNSALLGSGGAISTNGNTQILAYENTFNNNAAQSGNALFLSGNASLNGQPLGLFAVPQLVASVAADNNGLSGSDVVIDTSGLTTQILYVNAANANPIQDGLSWNSAYSNLQTALNAAKAITSAAPDTFVKVEVAAGDYSITSNHSESFTLPNNVAIIGGFVGTSANETSNPAANVTILDGSGLNAPILTVADAIGAVQGVTFTGANDSTGSGGAILETGGSSLWIGNDLFNANAAFMGGAIGSENSTLVIASSSFAGNTAAVNGGAIYADGSNVWVNASQFTGNSAFSGGAAALSNSSSFIATKDIFQKNSATEGGALFIQGSSPVEVWRSTFGSPLTSGQGNQASDSGGAIALIDNGDAANLVDNVFGGNSASGSGGAIYAKNDSALTLTSSDPSYAFTDNTAGSLGGAIAADGITQSLSLSGYNFTGNSAQGGGAISIQNTTAFSLDGQGTAFFKANSASGTGGAVDVQNISQSAGITGYQFIDNTAADGGALGIAGAANSTIANDQFTGNSAANQGGAVYLSADAAALLSGDTFSQNAANEGGALAAYSVGNLSISAGGFTDNSASTGSALWMDLGGLSINNSQFSIIAAQQDGVLIDASQAGTINISQSAFDLAGSLNSGALYLHGNDTVNLLSDTFDGHGVLSSNSAVQLLNNQSVVIDSSAFKDFHAAGNGGAIFAENNTTLEIIAAANPTVFQGNTAGGNGGALYAINNGTILLDGKSNGILFSNNASPGSGGAAYMEGTQLLNILNTAFNSNSSPQGVLTLANGWNATLNSDQFTGNSGPALYAYSDTAGQGDVTLLNSSFTDNQASGGAAINAAGIAALNLVNDTFSGNSSLTSGVVAVDNALAVLVNGSAFNNNSAAGGGILAVGNTRQVYIDQSSFNGNASSAVYLYALNPGLGQASITNTQFTGNQGSSGGALRAVNLESLNLASDTFAGNSALTQGGAVYTSDLGRMAVLGNAFSNNASQSEGGAFYDSGSANVYAFEGNTFNENGAPSGPSIYFTGETGASPSALNLYLLNDDTANGTQDILVNGAGLTAPITRIYVEADNSSAVQNGQSWTTAYSNLQEALSQASQMGTGVQIWVAQGTYTPGSTVNSTFALPNNAALFGGFAGTEQMLSQRNPGQNATILSGDIGVLGNNTDNIQTIVTANGINAALDGFTVTGAYNPAGTGGGLAADNSNIVLANDIFSGNYALNGAGVSQTGGFLAVADSSFSSNIALIQGGGIFMTNASAFVAMSQFTGDSAFDGGGIAAVNSGAVTIDGSQFSGNQADRGGGLYLYYDHEATVEGSLFSQNTATWGAGLYSENDNLAPGRTIDILASQFTQNDGIFAGGGAAIQYNSDVSVIGSTFASNQGAEGAGLYINQNGNAALAGNLFTQNSAVYGGGLYSTFNNNIAISDTFSANSATDNGGGLYSSGDNNLIVAGSTFSQNTSSAEGGGIYLDNDVSAAIQASFIGNSASSGGAVYAGPGTIELSIANSNFTGNHAIEYGANLLNIANPFELSNYGSPYEAVIPALLDNGSHVVDLSQYASAIDSGQLMFNLSALFGGIDNSFATTTDTVTITYYGQVVNPQNLTNLPAALGQDVLGGSTLFQRQAQTGLIPESLIKTLPAGTRSIIITLSGEGFTENVAFSVFTADNGGGAVLANQVNVVQIANSAFSQNTASYGGGAVKIVHSNIINMSGDVFNGNTAAVGGAADLESTNSIGISGSFFTGNLAYGQGGAIYASNTSGDISVSDSVFSDNMAENSGGAIYADSAFSFDLTGSAFAGNSATDSAGAVLINQVDTIHISNDAFIGNSSKGTAGALAIRNSLTFLDTASITSTLFESNKAVAVGGALSIVNDQAVNLGQDQFLWNAAKQGGAVYASNNASIGIANVDFAANEAVFAKNITDAAYQSNIHMAAGGALFAVQNGAITLSGNNLFEDNQASVEVSALNGAFTAENNLYAAGGAIYAIGNALFNILAAANASSLFSGNTATLAMDSLYYINNNVMNALGGAIYVAQGSPESVHQLNSNSSASISGTFANNAVSAGGGTLPQTDNTANLSGGAIYSDTLGTTTISAGTFINNSSGNSLYNGIGGAVAILSPSSALYNGNIAIANSTFSFNNAGQDGSIAVSAAGEINLTSNTFSDNYSSNGGAGNIDIQNSLAVTAVSNVFSGNNTLGYGGALAIEGPTLAALQSNTFEGNFAASGGGALYASLPVDLELDGNNVFAHNSTQGFGGAVLLEGQTGVTLFKASSGNTFTGNSAAQGGGAVYFQNTAAADIESNTFTANIAKGNGGAVGGTDSNEQITFSGNTFSANQATQGGAVSITGTFNALNVQGNTFSSNNGGGSGGGLYIDQSAANGGTFGVATVSENNVFTSNSAAQGGAIYGQGGILNIEGNAFYSNIAGLNGGALLATLSTPTISQNIFQNNSATTGGAIESDDNTNPTINGQNRFIGNSAVTGGAIQSFNDTGLVISVDTFDQNSSTYSGGAVEILNSSNATVNSSDFEGNTTHGTGGAIYASNASNLLISADTFNLNNADYSGGALSQFQGGLILSNSTFTDNTSARGGAVLINQGTASISGNVFSDNQAGNLGNDFNIYTTLPFSVNGYTNTQDIQTSLAGQINQLNANPSNDILISSAPVDTNSYTIYVDQNSTSADPNGSSWSSAFKTLVDAIHYANTLDVFAQKTIYIAEGTYLTSTTGSQDTSLVLAGNYNIYGGFVPGQTSPSQRDLSNPADATVITGALSPGLHSQSVFEVVEGNVTLDGLTITGANGYTGGGIVALNSGLTIANDKITNNIVGGSGGGIYDNNGPSGNLTVTNTVFANNGADNGGAIYAADINNVTIDNSAFIANSAFTDGGALFTQGLQGGVAISGSQFTSNTAGSIGAAVMDSGSNNVLTISNTVFSGNNSGYKAAVEADNASAVTITGSTFTSNSASLDGALEVASTNSLTISSSSFIGNGSTSSTFVADGVPPLDNAGAVRTDLVSTVLIQNSLFRNNSGGDGGALNASYSDFVTIENSNFINNTALYNGGAVSLAWNKDVTVSGGTFQNNTAEGQGVPSDNLFDYGLIHGVGGAISSFPSQIVSIDGAAFEGNSAYIGGAVFLGGSYQNSSTAVQFSITNSTFDSNTASGSASAIFIKGSVDANDSIDYTGPQVYVGSLAMNNDTISNNVLANSDTSGIDGTATVLLASLQDITVSNSLIVNNSVNPVPDFVFYQGAFTLTSDYASTFTNDLFANDNQGAIDALSGSLTLLNNDFLGINDVIGGGTVTGIGVVADGNNFFGDSAALNFTGNSTFTDNHFYNNNGALNLTANYPQFNAVFTISGNTFGGVITNTQLAGEINTYLGITTGNTLYGNDGAITIQNGTSIIDSNIFDGNINYNAGDGGAIYIFGYYANAIINNNTFIDNAAPPEGGFFTGEGGAIYAWNDISSLTITNNEFMGNSAAIGGAIAGNFNYDAGAQTVVNISNNTFTANSAQQEGGAISLQGTLTGNIENNTFTNNMTAAGMGGSGGALYVGIIPRYDSDTINIFSNAFTGNSADQSGGAIMSNSNHFIWISNNTFSGNTANASGGAIASTSDSFIKMTGNSFSGNSASTDGGAVYTNNDTNLLVFQNDMNGNTAQYGGGIYIGGILPWFLDGTFENNNAQGNGNDVYLALADGSVYQSNHYPTIDLPAGSTSTVNSFRYVIYVNGNNPDPNPNDPNIGTSWAAAYGNLQDALNFANSLPSYVLDKQVWVAGGTYTPDTTSTGVLDPGNAADTFVIPDRTALYGGFAGNETSPGQRNLQTNQATILSGVLGNGAYADNIVTLVDRGLLDGFTISGGQGVNGSAVIDTNTNGVLFLSNDIIKDNTASNQGGALYSSAVTFISHVLFSDNTALQGGAVYLDQPALAAITFSQLTDNSTTDGSQNAFGGALDINGGGSLLINADNFSGDTSTFGGAIYANQTQSIALGDTSFENNSAAQGGALNLNNIGTLNINGTLTTVNGSPTSTSQFSGNQTSGQEGGAIYENGVGISQIFGTLFNGNASPLNGGAFYSAGSSIITLRNDVFQNNTNAVSTTNSSVLTIDSNTFKSNRSGAAQGVVSSSNDQNAILENNTFVNNTGSAVAASSDQSLDVHQNTFDNNSSSAMGGALDSTGNAYVSIKNNVFSENSALDGGALAISGSTNVLVSGNTFTGDSAAGNGGGLYIQQTGYLAQIIGNTFSLNQGGALWSSGDAQFDLTSNIFTSNMGGAAAFSNDGALFADSNTFTGNQNGNGNGGALWVQGTTMASISNNTFDANQAANGGALALTSDGQVKVIGDTFAGNSATGQGGALYADSNAALAISGSSFNGNLASNGGGGYILNTASLEIYQNTFSANQAGAMGGALGIEGVTSSLLAYNNTFTDNTAGQDGGAIYVNDVTASDLSNINFSAMTALANGNSLLENSFNSAVELLNVYSFGLFSNSFTGNSAGDSGGALYLANSNDVQLVLNTFTDNQASNSGGAVSLNIRQNAVVASNTFRGNSAGTGGALFTNQPGALFLNQNLFNGDTATNNAGNEIRVVSYDIFGPLGQITINGQPDIGDGSIANVQKAILSANTFLTPSAQVSNNIDLGVQTYIIYVDSSQTSVPGNGQSWSTAFNNIQSAVDYAATLNSQAEKLIWIAGGTYTPDSSISLPDFTALFGGFKGNETALSQRPTVVVNGQTELAVSTIINGSSLHSSVFTASNDNVALEDLTITGGSGVNGGALLADFSNVIVNDVSFIGNSATQSGGAAAILNSNLSLIENSLFAGNTSLGNGGALWAESSLNITLQNDVFQNNASSGSGGAFYAGLNANVVINLSSFSHNSAQANGGGAAADNNSAVTLTSSAFDNNSAAQGGGFEASGNGSVLLKAVNFGNNTAAAGGGLSIANTSSSVSVASANFTDNSAVDGGAAIFNQDGSLSLATANFIGNRAGAEGGAAVLSNLTAPADLSNNTFSSNLSPLGGALYLANDTSITLRHNAFTGNGLSTGYGGAIDIENTTLASLQLDNTFNDNIAAFGGAIYSDYNGLQLGIDTGVFTNNSASDGGAIYLEQSAVVSIADSTFTGNSAANDGGALYSQGGNIEIFSNDIFKGNAADRGGALFLLNNTRADIENNSQFIGNAAGLGGAIYSQGNSSLQLTGGTLQSNTAATGGAIYSMDDQSLIINLASFLQNSASGTGGALYISSDQSAILSDSAFNGNSASGSGGAVYLDRDQLAVISSDSFGSNTSGAFGGAIYAYKGQDVVIGGIHAGNTFSLNKASLGGGAIMLDSGNVASLMDNAFAGNSTGGSGGAVLSNFVRELTMTGNTFSNDSAASGNEIFASVIYSNVFQEIAQGIFVVNGISGLDSAANIQNGITSQNTFLSMSSQGISVGTLTTDIYVNAKQTQNTANGKSWSTAFNNLQDALALANTLPGEKYILVAQGTYKPSLSDRSASFALPDLTALYGGYSGIGTVRNVNSYPTILNGDPAGGDVYHVITANGVAAILDGFTVTNGQALGTGTDSFGGGLYAIDSSLILSHMNFTGDSAANSGGAVYINQSPIAIIEDSSFVSNSAGDNGGAIYVGSSGTVQIQFNFNISGNTAADGAGVYAINNNTLLFDNNLFAANDASGLGGGAYLSNNDLSVITLNTFAYNSAFEGSAIYGVNGPHIIIQENNINANPSLSGGFFDNYSQQGGAVAIFGNTFDVNMANNTLSNSPYSLINKSYLEFANNSAPYFVSSPAESLPDQNILMQNANLQNQALMESAFTINHAMEMDHAIQNALRSTAQTGAALLTGHESVTMKTGQPYHQNYVKAPQPKAPAVFPNGGTSAQNEAPLGSVNSFMNPYNAPKPFGSLNYFLYMWQQVLNNPNLMAILPAAAMAKQQQTEPIYQLSYWGRLVNNVLSSLKSFVSRTLYGYKNAVQAMVYFANFPKNRKKFTQLLKKLNMNSEVEDLHAGDSEEQAGNAPAKEHISLSKLEQVDYTSHIPEVSNLTHTPFFISLHSPTANESIESNVSTDDIITSLVDKHKSLFGNLPL